jgi:hypothetical protein
MTNLASAPRPTATFADGEEIVGLGPNCVLYSAVVTSKPGFAGIPFETVSSSATSLCKEAAIAQAVQGMLALWVKYLPMTEKVIGLIEVVRAEYVNHESLAPTYEKFEM